MSLGKAGMITVDFVHRRYFPDKPAGAARSAIKRLCGKQPGHGYLVSEPLDAKRVYYRLTPLGTKALGISADYATALKKQGRVRRYAITWFIHGDRPGERTLFNPRDHPEVFPVSGHSLPKHPFYFDRADDHLRIGFILVDHSANVRRTVHKTLKPLGRFLSRGWFDDYIRTERFVVTILTFSSGRANAIRRQLLHAVREHFGTPLSRLRPDLIGRFPLEIRVVAVPAMAAVVASGDWEKTD